MDNLGVRERNSIVMAAMYHSKEIDSLKSVMNAIFVGHGSEDTEFYLRAKKLLGCSDERFNTCLHMPHAATHTPFQVKKNAQILDSLKNSGNWGDIAEILQFEYNKKWGSIQPCDLLLRHRMQSSNLLYNFLN